LLASHADTFREVVFSSYLERVKGGTVCKESSFRSPEGSGLCNQVSEFLHMLSFLEELQKKCEINSACQKVFGTT